MAGLEFSHLYTSKGYQECQQAQTWTSWGANFGLEEQFTRGPQFTLIPI